MWQRSWKEASPHDPKERILKPGAGNRDCQDRIASPHDQKERILKQLHEEGLPAAEKSLTPRSERADTETTEVEHTDGNVVQPHPTIRKSGYLNPGSSARARGVNSLTPRSERADTETADVIPIQTSLRLGLTPRSERADTETLRMG